MDSKILPDLLLSKLKQTDFWNFFNIHITDEKKIADTTVYYLKPGGYQTEVDLTIKENQKNQITESILFIKRDWLLGEPHGINPFALDIAGSFIEANVSPADAKNGRDLKLLFSMQNAYQYYEIFKHNADDKTISANILKVYFGLDEHFSLLLNHSNVVFENQITGAIGRIVIQTKIIYS